MKINEDIAALFRKYAAKKTATSASFYALKCEFKTWYMLFNIYHIWIVHFTID
jgi:hypothetical protein